MKNKLLILDRNIPKNNKDRIIKKQYFKIPDGCTLGLFQPNLDKTNLFQLFNKIKEYNIIFLNINIFDNNNDLLVLLGYIKSLNKFAFLYNNKLSIPKFLIEILEMKKNIFFLKFATPEELNLDQVVKYVQKNN